MMKKLRFLGLFTLLVILILSVAACGGKDKKPGSIESASILYDGIELKWNAADNAASYAICINGKENITTGTTSYSFAANADSMTFEITPIGYKGTEGETVSRTFTRLGGGESMEIRFAETGEASWDAISGASQYIVDVNGKQHTVTTTSFSEFEWGKRNSIRVKPSSVDNSTFSSWSKTVTKMFLGAPSRIDFDGTYLTWQGTSEATAYEIYINDGLYDTVQGAAQFAYKANDQTFRVCITTRGDGENTFTSPKSEEFTFVYFPQITEFTIQNGEISWPAVDDATSYSVKINNTTQSVTEPCFTDLITGYDNIVSVMPVAEGSQYVKYFSKWSAEQKVHIIAAPMTSWNDSLAHDGMKMNSFLWEPVQGIDHYEICVVHPSGQKESFTASAADDSFAYDYLEAGTYEISIKAVPLSGTGYYESSYSAPIQVVRLAPPSPAESGAITSNAAAPASEFTIHVKNQLDASGYSVFFEGNQLINAYQSAQIPVSGFLSKTVVTEQQYTFQVQAIGERLRTSSNGQRKVTLSSLSDHNYTVIVTVLGVPSNLAVSGKTMTWDGSINAHGYKLTGFSGETTTASFDLSAINSPGDYTLQIFAKGDGKSVLSSPVSEIFRVRKLSAPLDLHVIPTGESEGKVDFTPVKGAKSYRLLLDGSNTYYDTNDIDNINDLVTTASVSIRVSAIADAYDDADGIYCLSSEPSARLTLTKLSAPVWGETPYSGSNLIWVGASNVLASPGYLVYTANGLAYEGIYNSTTFSLESFAPGTYTFTVKAVGDGYTTINSDMSSPITVTKLATPEVSISDDRTCYVWKMVTGAQRYVVYVDGKLVETVESANGVYFAYTPKAEHFNNAQGTHTVAVTAISDSAIDSTPCKIEQVTKQLTVPTVEVSYSDQSFNPNGYLIINATAGDVKNTQGFVFIVDGNTSEPQTNGQYTFSTKNTGKYTVSVVAQGGLFDENGVYYLNSQENAGRTLTLLAAPGVQTIQLSASGTLKWNAVSGALNGYEVVIEYDDGTTETFTVPSATPQYTFDVYDAKYNPDGKFHLDKAQLYRFKIRALGSGSSVIASQYVEWDQSMN